MLVDLEIHQPLLRHKVAMAVMDRIGLLVVGVELLLLVEILMAVGLLVMVATDHHHQFLVHPLLMLAVVEVELELELLEREVLAVVVMEN
jgi:hypothetical protein